MSTKQLRSPNDGRVWSILWCGVYSLVVLGICFLYQWQGQGTRPPGLTSVLIPANLFTGVFLCGVTCLCNPWMDRCLPRELRLSPLLVALNYVVGCLFVAIAIKGAWDQYGLQAVLIFMGTIITGCIAAAIWNVRRRDPRS